MWHVNWNTSINDRLGARSVTPPPFGLCTRRGGDANLVADLQCVVPRVESVSPQYIPLLLLSIIIITSRLWCGNELIFVALVWCVSKVIKICCKMYCFFSWTFVTCVVTGMCCDFWFPLRLLTFKKCLRRTGSCRLCNSAQGWKYITFCAWNISRISCTSIALLHR